MAFAAKRINHTHYLDDLKDTGFTDKQARGIIRMQHEVISDTLENLVTKNEFNTEINKVKVELKEIKAELGEFKEEVKKELDGVKSEISEVNTEIKVIKESIQWLKWASAGIFAGIVINLLHITLPL